MWKDEETHEDLLGYSVHASMLKNIILNDTMLPISIGLFGNWGCGKSSLMLQLEHELNQTMHSQNKKSSKGRTTSNWSNRFKMIKTENMWTFILLDTYNGRLWQVQYSAQDLDNTFCIPINEQPLASTLNSIFSIQPLTSMFQYYLINESTGKMWKFQWSTKGDDYRWIEKM